VVDLYDTVPNDSVDKKVGGDLSGVDEVVFTSKSTVDAWLAVYGAMPPKEKCVSLGDVTQAHIDAQFN
jgi:uroporphyrinogen-III synthase